MKIKKKIENISCFNFIEQYLSSCGIEDVDRYLNPDRECFDNPLDYLNMKDAVELFDKHVKAKSKVGIVVDSDMDGACSSAIIYMFCKEHSLNPKVYFHSGKQHGIHDKVDELINDNLQLIIVPDAGTNDDEDCQKIKDFNPECDILILDHHDILNRNVYATIVNNQCGNVNKKLSGTGVTYKFIQAYCILNNLPIPNYEDIVAVSIISDVCDLTSLENRAFVHYGLNNPQNPFLIEIFNTVCKYRGVCPESIGWDVSPLANSLARVDDLEYKSFFFRCLTGEQSDYEEAIKEMKKIKRKQDTIVKEITKEIEENLDLNHKTIIAFTAPENKEILGLIANKFTGKYRKPTILLRELNSTTWTGSLRSPFDLLTIINKSNIAQCMGHGCACGVIVKKSNVNKLIKFLDTLDVDVDPEFEVVDELSIDDITLDLAQDISDYKILWGKNVEKPRFYIHLENPSVDIFRKSMTTIKLTENGISFIKFFCSDEMVKEFENLNNKAVNIIFEIEVNEYNDIKSPQCNIIEYEIEENPIFKNEEEFDWDKIFV